MRCNDSKAVPLASTPNSAAILKAHYSTSSMSPRCPWISWDKSRSRPTGLLHETWRLKSKLSMPLQKEASSRSRKERKFSYNQSQSCSRWGWPGWNASLSFQAQHPHAAHTPTQAAGPQRYTSTHRCKRGGCFPFISHYHHITSIRVKKYQHPRTPLPSPRKLSFCLVTSHRVLSDFELYLSSTMQ